MFFGMIERFNEYRPINQKFRKNVYYFFEYKWENDNNQAIKSE